MTQQKQDNGNIMRGIGRGLLLSALVLYPIVAGKNFDPQNMIMHCVITAAVLLWYIGRMMGNQPVAVIRYPWLDWSLAGFFGLNVIAAFFSVYHFASLLSLIWLADILLVYWMAREAFVRGIWRSALIAALVTAGAICAVWGLREYIHTVFFTGGATWRIFGPLYNPNILAAYLIGSLFMAAGVLSVYLSQDLDQPKQKQEQNTEAPRRLRFDRIGVAVAVLMIAPTILLTGSRGGLLGLMAGILVFVAFRLARYWSVRRIVVAVVGIALVLGLAVSVVPPIRDRLTQAFSLQNHSVAFRYHTWLGTIDMAAAHPLTGTGPGTYEYAYPRYAKAGFTRSAHQTFLQVGAEAGIPALIAFMVIGVAALRRLWRKLTRSNVWVAALASAAAGWLVALGVHNLVDYSLTVPAVTATALALLGLSLASAATLEENVTISSPSRVPAVMLAALLVCGIWLLIGLHSTVSAENAASRGLWYQAEKAATRATTMLPMSADAWSTRADVQLSQSRSPDDQRVQDAIQMTRRATQLAPTHAKHHLSLVRLYAFAGEPEKALQQAKRALEIYPTNARALAELARMQQAVGQEQAASETYRRLVELYDSPVGRFQAIPEIPDYNFVWGWLHFAEKRYADGDTQQGQGFVFKGIKLLNQRLRGQRGLIELQQKTTGKRPAELQRLEILADRIEALLSAHPDPGLKLRLARTRDLLGQWHAHEVLLRAIADSYETADEPSAGLRTVAGAAYLELGDLYEGRGEDGYALEDYQRGLKLLKDLPESAASDDLPAGAEALDLERLRRLRNNAQKMTQSVE
ncbi:MAG: O-antigen ligase family protein [Armatimonadota bacterium]